MPIDFSWIHDPSAWIGLGTLIVIEIVLGIDNLIFISILSSRLPEGKKQQAFSLGLSIALLMRLVLLSAIAWIVTLTKPLLEVFGAPLSARDIILIIGGFFLLFKGTIELHDRIEGHNSAASSGARDAVFWQVVVQIIVLDAIFSLDSVITSVGMVKDLTVMMLAVIVAMLTMLLAARPLTHFVEKHPSVIVLCLGFLLMIGLSLIMDGFGLHIPKGYLYAAIAFSVLVEMFNQLSVRSRRLKITTRNLRESAARSVLGLLGGSCGTTQLEMAAFVSNAGKESVFDAEERDMLARVIRIGGRTARYIMTPRRRMESLSCDASLEETLRTVSQTKHPFVPIQNTDSDEILGILHLHDLVLQIYSNDTFDLKKLLHPVQTIFEHTPLPDLIDILRKKSVPVFFVQDEYGAIVGMIVTEDILYVIAGRMGETCPDPATLQQADGSWKLPGRLSIDEITQIFNLSIDTNAATLAGLLLEQLGHIPVEGEEWELKGLHWKIVHMDRQRIDTVVCKKIQ